MPATRSQISFLAFSPQVFWNIWIRLAIYMPGNGSVSYTSTSLRLAKLIGPTLVIIEGAASIVVAVAAFYLLPDWPHNTKFLAQEEKEMAQYRVLVSNGGIDEGIGGTWDGLKDAVRDPFTWLFCGMHFALVTAQSFKDFFPSVSHYSGISICFTNILY
jgi:hypothetical protein